MQISFLGFYVLTRRTEGLRLRDDVGIVPYAGCRMVWFDRARRMSGSRDDVGIVPYAGCRMVWFDRARGISGLRDDVGIVPYAGCRMVWFDRAGGISGLRDDVSIVPYAEYGHQALREEGKNPAGPLGVSRVKNTCYTARKNFTRNRAEMA